MKKKGQVNFYTNFLFYLTNIESATFYAWSTKVPLVAEFKSWSGDLDTAFQAAYIMFLQFWFPFVPEFVELFQNIKHFLVDHLFVSLLLFNPNFFFRKISKRAIVEFFKNLHVTFSKSVQVFFKFSTLGSSSFIQTFFVLTTFVSFEATHLLNCSLILPMKAIDLASQALIFFSDSMLNAFNLSKKVFFLSFNPDISLCLQSLTETVDFFLSWLNSAIGHWKHF